LEKIWKFEGTLAYISSLISSGLMSSEASTFFKASSSIFTPRYEKRKWKYYYIFSVVGNDSVSKSSDECKIQNH